MSVLVDLKNRGVADVFFVVCDGLKGLPDTVEAVWPQAIVQTCIIHLIRNTFRLTSRADADAIKRTSNRSTPHRTLTRRWPHWTTWRRNGVASTGR
jgi:transposase-like protein